MRKKYGVILAGALVMLACAVTGCNKTTPEGLLKEAMDNSKKASSFEGALEMDMKMKIAQSGVSMDMEAAADLDITATNDPAAYHIKGNLDLDVMGLSMDMEMYGEEKDGQNITYTYDTQKEEWSKTVSEKTKDDDSNAMILDLGTIVRKKNELKLAEKTEKENKQEVYVITTEVSGEDISDVMEATGDLMGDMADLELSKAKADVTIRIYKESRLPASVSVKMENGPGGSLADDGNGTQVQLESFSYAISFKEYNAVKKIAIPKEALRAEETQSNEDLLDDLAEEEPEEPEEEDDTLQTDEKGNYILTNWDKLKEVTLSTPKGYELSDESTCYSIVFENTEVDPEDGYLAVDYKLEEFSDYWTEEDMIQGFAADKDTYEASQEYSNIKYQDKKQIKVGDFDVSYISLSYDYEDKIHQENYLAWVDLPEDFAIKCRISFYGNYGQQSLIDESTLYEELFKGIKIE